MALISLIGGLAGCQGEVGSGSGPSGAGAGGGTGGAMAGAPGTPNQDTGQTLAACQGSPEPQARLSRLTHPQYANSAADLLGLQGTTIADGFLADAARSGFDNNASGLQIEPRLLQDYQAAAEELASNLLSDPNRLAELVSCQAGAACRDEFVSRFGRRAFRRPLTDAEKVRYGALFDNAPALSSQTDALQAGIGLVVEAMLQSPAFLYRAELGHGAPAAGVVALTPHELAARLSYALWNGPPDDELSAIADRGELSTGDALRVQAQRLLADPRALGVVDSFHRQHLGLAQYSDVERDAALYPLFVPGTAALLGSETAAFIRDVFGQKQGFGALFTSPFTYVNQQTAPLYELSGNFGADLARVDLDPTKRAGFLTQLGFLTQNAHFDKTSPIHRGVFILRKLLCVDIPDPPADVDPTLPPLMGEITTNRQAVERHTSPVSCSGCHGLINPVGFGFEHYDATGRYQAADHGTPVDASGTMTLDGQAVTFQNAVELSSLLAGSTQAQACYARNWLRFLYARTEHSADECVIGGLAERMGDPSYGLTTLLSDLTTTHGFMTTTEQPL